MSKRRWATRVPSFYNLTIEEYTAKFPLGSVNAYVGVMKQAMREGRQVSDRALLSLIMLGKTRAVKSYINSSKRLKILK